MREMARMVRAKGRAEYRGRRHRCTVSSIESLSIVKASSCTSGGEPVAGALREDAPAVVQAFKDALRAPTSFIRYL